MMAVLVGAALAAPLPGQPMSPASPTTPITPVNNAVSCAAPNPLPVASVGDAVVFNNCPFDVYLQSVAGADINPVVTVRPGSNYTEEYRTGPNSAGVAIKITNNSTDWSTPMLFEYTPSTVLDTVWYDMSISVGGQEQGTGGLGDSYQLVPSVIDSDVDCVPVTYSDSYTHLGEDDDATKSCPLSTSLVLHLCDV